MNNKRYKLIFDVDNNHAIFIGGAGEPTTVVQIPPIAPADIPQVKQTTLKIPITATTYAQLPSKPMVLGQTTAITDSDISSEKQKAIIPITATATAQVPTQTSVQAQTTVTEITKLPNYGKEIPSDLTKEPKGK